MNDICDNRKDLAEKERQSVMNEGWLEDRLGLLTNFYITLMQAEVDRYQDTVRLLRDYYVGMEGEEIQLENRGVLLPADFLLGKWTGLRPCLRSTYLGGAAQIRSFNNKGL